MTPTETAKVVAMLQAAYPAARWSEPTVDLYELMLADLDYGVARDTVARIIRTAKFLPSVSEVLEAAADLTLGELRSPVDAWGDVGAQIRAVGHYGVPRFKDPIVAHCVRAMGWRNLCIGDSPEASDRARFCELYAHQQQSQRKRDQSEPGLLLPGAQHAERRLVSGSAMPIADLLRGLNGVGDRKPTTSPSEVERSDSRRPVAASDLFKVGSHG